MSQKCSVFLPFELKCLDGKLRMLPEHFKELELHPNSKLFRSYCKAFQGFSVITGTNFSKI